LLKRIVSGIIFMMLLVGMLTLAFNIQPVEAELKTWTVDDDGSADFSKIRDAVAVADIADASRASIKHWSMPTIESFFENGLDTRLMDVFEASGKWDFSNEVKWGDFAYVDDDSAELVIGLDDMRPNSYSELVDLIVSYGGELVHTVSMDSEIRAVVADMSHVAMSTFVSEVEIAGWSRYIEPNVRFEIDFVPNDPDWSKQWGPHVIEADYAWNITTGDPSVLVAVIDTGIDWDHPDLAANYVALGYDWVNNDPDPMDDHGHGTHCAGVIAAIINNNIGIAGLAQVHIMAEKGLDGLGGGRSDELANAIVHAVDQGADILSCSWGSYAKSTVVHEALKYAHEHDVLVIGAAGNDATSAKHYPAAYDEVVAVTATDESDNTAEFSNFGDWGEVAAPGVHIYSTVWDDSYAYMSGTSMSAPHVSGVASLIWSQFPSMTRDQVRAQLRYTADDLGDPGFDVYYGYGRVNARRAVEQAPFDHDVLVLSWQKPQYVNLKSQVTINSTILNMGTSDESGITVQLLVNDSVVDSKIVSSLVSGAFASVSCLWVPTVEGVYNVTSYVVPVLGETVAGNNVLSAYIPVRIPKVIRVPDDCETIQGAIDAAIDGDTVFVASGTYCENLWINKEGLTLVGEDVSSTIIQKAEYVVVAADDVNVNSLTVQNGDIGIVTYYSKGSKINNTRTSNNEIGIYLLYSANIALINNNMTGNSNNLDVDGYSLSDFIHKVDTSNLVNGKPVYYWIDEHDKQVPSDAGYVAAVNSTKIVIKDLNMTDNGEGVLLACTTNSIIEHVNVSNNYDGVYLAHSSVNTVSGCFVTNNYNGIHLYESINNNISCNMVIGNSNGISSYYSNDNKIDFNKLLDNDLGLFLEKSNGNTASSNEVLNNTYGIYAQRSSYNILSNNNMTSNKYNFGVVGGHLFHFIHNIDTSNTVDGKPIHYLVNRKDLVIDPSTYPNLGYLGIVNSTNINVNNLTVTNNTQGILFAYTNNSIIRNISTTSNRWGILMIESFGNTMSYCAMTTNRYNIDLWYSHNNTINRNMMARAGADGVYLLHSSNNNIVDNNMTTNWSGIWLDISDANNITNNIITENTHGITLCYSSNNVLNGNNMTANSYNFGINGYSLSDFIQDIKTSNTVDGNPIYYWVNQHDEQVPFDAGYVALINCTNITAKDLNMKNNAEGILLAYATKCTVSNVTSMNNYDAGIWLIKSKENFIIGNTLLNIPPFAASYGLAVDFSNENRIIDNTLSENLFGIYLYYSDNNILSCNNVTGGTIPSGLVGICLTRATGNTISDNVLSDNRFIVGAGIYLEWSSNNNTILRNTLENNQYGVNLGGFTTGFCNNNTMYYNNFIENTEQVLTLNSINTWDNGYPSGGNFWSDYAGNDACTGLYQNMTGSDGIGDTPYVIDKNNKDRYPLINPWKPPIPGDINKDGKVDMRDIALAARAFGSHPNHPRWNLIGDINQDDKIDLRDIAIIARNFGKKS
jgi:parallel beta-helix repeat protein